jgi:hypothetical protein
MDVKTKFVKKNSWCTLEKFWNKKKAIIFYGPPNIKIRLKYGPPLLSITDQIFVLDGASEKLIEIGKWSLLTAKVEALADTECFINYTVKQE